MMTKSLGVVCALSLFGCSGYQLEAAGTPAVDLLTAPPGGVAKICVLRPQSNIFTATAVIRDNGSLVGATGGHSYFCYLAEPGEHVVRSEAEREAGEIRTNAMAGGSYYLDQFIDADGPHMRFEQQWVDE